MSTRDSDSEHTNGGANTERPRTGFEDIPSRVLLEDVALRGELTANKLDASIEDSKRRDAANTEKVLAAIAATDRRFNERFDALDKRFDIVEGGVLELVVDNRARKNEIDKVRTESRESLGELRSELARASRISQVDEEERKVILTLANTGARAAADHLGVKTAERVKQVEADAATKTDALEARKERRGLVVAGLKKIAPIAIPVLTAAAGALAVAIARGC